jgi:hypothetical protein
MVSWVRDLDELLRGRKTGAGALAKGTEHLPVGRFLVLIVVLGMVYGIFMGLYALLNRTPPCYEQWLAATVKVPAVFLLTLVVTFPSLYVFNALLDTRLTLMGTLRAITAALTVNLAVLASLGPIAGFFALTTGSYAFMKLLNYAFFGVAGSVGLTFLVAMLNRIASAPGPVSAPAASDGANASGGAALPVAEPANDARGSAVFRVWVLLYIFVGAQMGWVLRPFIGAPDQPFEWFRARQSNVFMDLLRTIGAIFQG